MSHTPRTLCALAFDTSAYTTSVAVVSADGEILYDGRAVLNVPEGQRGLRQSEALFQHVVNLPDLVAGAEPVLRRCPPAAVAASVSPRNLPDSYMPVFRAGYAVARSLAAALGVPFLPCSHQEGHFWAAFLDLQAVPPVDEPFLAVHVSGGTTEALVGRLQADGRLSLTIAGATGDLTAGKFIDRVGVALGFGFPAGAAVERCAAGVQEAGRLDVKPAVQGTSISFSGPLTALERQIRQQPPEAVAYAAQQVLAKGLAQWACNVVRAAFAEPPKAAYWVGGVAANGTLRAEATAALRRLGVERILFAAPKFSTDNAVGVAYYAARQKARADGFGQE